MCMMCGGRQPPSSGAQGSPMPQTWARARRGVLSGQCTRAELMTTQPCAGRSLTRGASHRCRSVLPAVHNGCCRRTCGWAAGSRNASDVGGLADTLPGTWVRVVAITLVVDAACGAHRRWPQAWGGIGRRRPCGAACRGLPPTGGTPQPARLACGTCCGATSSSMGAQACAAAGAAQAVPAGTGRRTLAHRS